MVLNLGILLSMVTDALNETRVLYQRRPPHQGNPLHLVLPHLNIILDLLLLPLPTIPQRHHLQLHANTVIALATQLINVVISKEIVRRRNSVRRINLGKVKRKVQVWPFMQNFLVFKMTTMTIPMSSSRSFCFCFVDYSYFQWEYLPLATFFYGTSFEWEC